MTDIPFTTYAYQTTGRPTSRTTPARFAEIYNVMDFGAEASGRELQSIPGIVEISQQPKRTIR